MICKELNKSYDSKAEMFKALRINKDAIIKEKRAQVFKSFEKGVGIAAKFMDSKFLQEHVKDIQLDEDYYYIAVNSSRILDSHGDLHLDGNWNKTVKEQQGKNYLVWDHELKATSTIVRKEHIEMFTAMIPFSAIGKSYEGETEALIYKFRKDNIKSDLAKEWLESGDDIEASVRMQYVKMELAMNSDDEEDKEFKKNFEKYHKVIANKADFEGEISYFWAVMEAKNVRESSLVLAGSNGATGQISSKNNEPFKSTQKQEPEAVEDTSLIEFLTHLTN